MYAINVRILKAFHIQFISLKIYDLQMSPNVDTNLFRKEK